MKKIVFHPKIVSDNLKHDSSNEKTLFPSCYSASNMDMEDVSLCGLISIDTLETKVFGRDNRITGSYGEIPKVEDILLQDINRDRTSTHYLKSSLIWAKLDFNGYSASSAAD